MEKYFIYYSLTGNGDLVAHHLKKKGYTPIKVETIKPISRNVNFFRIMKYGGDAMFNKKMKIQEVPLSLKEDDLVVVGSPIWNDRLSTPINSFLDQFNLNKKTTRFILYPAGKTTSKSFTQIKKLGFEGDIVVIPYPKKYIEETDKLLEEFVSKQ